MLRRLWTLSMAAVLWSATVYAEVKPHPLCSDGMVLQQKAKVNVWGTASPGEKVSVTFQGKDSSATANDAGKWLVSFETGAAGGPYPMTIAGTNKLDYKDVYVGEVWVCSGQSNMEWRIKQCSDPDEKVAAETPKNPLLRIFTVKKNAQLKPVDDVTGEWIESSPAAAPEFSAVAFYFGKDLQAALKVPVGLISTSWGGTRAEAWTSRDTLAKNPAYEKDLAPMTAAQANTAAALYNGMIYPILNYRIKGAIWYQGESNQAKAYQYRELFPTMITNWRQDWKQGDFPFFFVQLAPYLSVQKSPQESSWAELREAQALTLKLKNTGMAVITDFGNENDIHPTPKQPVGERLSLGARATVYGEKIEYSGPVYTGMKVEGNKAVLTFSHADSGLVAKEMESMKVKNKAGKEGTAWRVKPGSTNAALVGFAICGEDHTFHNATAEIVGNTVVVRSEQVSRPVAVRYGWADHPVCNLFNKEGLPASPFRTDDFPGKTAHAPVK